MTLRRTVHRPAPDVNVVGEEELHEQPERGGLEGQPQRRDGLPQHDGRVGRNHHDLHPEHLRRLVGRGDHVHHGAEDVAVHQQQRAVLLRLRARAHPTLLQDAPVANLDFQPVRREFAGVAVKHKRQHRYDNLAQPGADVRVDRDPSQPSQPELGVRRGHDVVPEHDDIPEQAADREQHDLRHVPLEIRLALAAQLAEVRAERGVNAHHPLQDLVHARPCRGVGGAHVGGDVHAHVSAADVYAEQV